MSPVHPTTGRSAAFLAQPRSATRTAWCSDPPGAAPSGYASGTERRRDADGLVWLAPDG